LKFFVPDIVVKDDYAAPETKLVEKLGGRPHGLKASDWPECQECGKSLSLLAQLAHSPDRLDLGGEGRTLFAFYCNHDPGMCDTWDHSSGANTCLVVEQHDLITQQSEMPTDAPPEDQEVFIAGWVEKNDTLDERLIGDFLDEDKYFDVSDELNEKVTWSTRLAGVPRWVQGADEHPSPGWEFLGQLDGNYSFLRPPSSPETWVEEDEHRFEGRTHVASGPNFAGTGVAYLFIRRTKNKPDVKLLWQS
jgi:hypothetical protein